MSSLDKKYCVTANTKGGHVVYADCKGNFGTDSNDQPFGIDYFKEAIPMTHEQAIKIIRRLDEKRKDNQSLWIYDWRMKEV